ncbi:MAG: hypothetical protein ACHP7J_00035 [Terriglobales bacterium]
MSYKRCCHKRKEHMAVEFRKLTESERRSIVLHPQAPRAVDLAGGEVSDEAVETVIRSVPMHFADDAFRLIDKLYITNPKVQTAAGDVVLGNTGACVVNKANGAATQVTLPARATSGMFAFVKDGKGDAATNNITVVPDGTTHNTTIDGSASYVMNVNYTSALFMHNGTEWSLLAAGSGALTLSTLTLTGLLTESAGDALTAAGTNQATALALTKNFNRVTTGASTTGVALPAAAAGSCVVIINSVANSIHVYGNNGAGDTINDSTTATGIVQPPRTAYIYSSTVAGKWYVMTAPIQEAQGTLTTVGAGTVLAATIANGLLLRTGPTSAFTDTTDTGTLLAAAIPNIGIGQSFEWTYQNSTYSVATLAGGTGVASAATFATVGPGSWATFVFTYSAANTFTVVQKSGGDNWIGLPSTSYSTGTTTTTFTAAEMTGGKLTVYTSTAATPGSIATATATAMFAAIQGAYVGLKWVFRVINDVATNSLTVTADGSVTLSGKTTYVATPFGSMDFEMTFTSPTAATMKYIGGGQSTTV